LPIFIFLLRWVVYIYLEFDLSIFLFPVDLVLQNEI